MAETRKTTVWSATNKCNLNCRFCFGKEDRKELSTMDAKLLIAKMRKMGAKYFVFSGGEPLLRKDIFELAGYAKKSGMKTILHTNGILLNRENIAKVTEYFDAVNLPIDGTGEKTNAMMGRGSLKHTLEMLDSLAWKCETRVSTIATKKNLGEIGKIAGLVGKRKIKKWRIFQFDPKLGAAGANRKAFEISAAEFSKLKKNIKNGNAEFVAANGNFEKKYWMVASDGVIERNV